MRTSSSKTSTTTIFRVVLRSLTWVHSMHDSIFLLDQSSCLWNRCYSLNKPILLLSVF
jgi:hypothetical protein